MSDDVDGSQRDPSAGGAGGSADVDADQLVERTDTGVSITTTLTRGTGTRDSDKHVVKAKGHDFGDAVAKHKSAMNYVEGELLERARSLQPEATVDLADETGQGEAGDGE